MKPLVICFLYGLTSVINNVSNKALVFQLKLPPFFLLFMQQFLMILALPLFRVNINAKVLSKCFPLAVFLIGSLGFGLIGMKYISLPMYLCIRKLTTLVIYLIGIYKANQKSTGTALGVILLSLGGLIAAMNDLNGDPYGYFIVFLSMIMNALQLLYSNQLYESGFDSNSIFFSVTLVILPISLGISSIYEASIQNIIEIISGDPYKYMILVLGCFFSGLSNYAMVLCSTQVSALAASVTGNTKDIFSMIIGLALFSDAQLNAPFIFGLFASTLGAGIYSYSKIKGY